MPRASETPLSFDELLDQAADMLRRRRRLTYRALKRQFFLDDECLEDLKTELIEGQRVARDEGTVLVWSGEAPEDAGKPRGRGVDATGTAGWVPPAAGDRRLAAPEPRPRAERRQLTVMFCDLVGSTRLSEQFDPEDLRDIIRKYQETAEAVFRRFGGYLAQYLGDGVLVYFGYPKAYEDAASRAVRAGLELIEQIGVLNRRLEVRHGVELAVRLGAHTGLVVIGEMGEAAAKQQLALGETPNLAARIQSLAEPGTLVISQSVHRLLEDGTRCVDLGFHPLKGVSEKTRLYQVIEAGRDWKRGDASGVPAALFGRRAELEQLIESWRTAEKGERQAVAVSGEAGIGKSSLVRSLAARARGGRQIVFRCSPYFTNSALYPVVELLREELRLTAKGSVKAQQRRLVDRVEELGLPVSEVVPIFSHLLSIEMSADAYPTQPISNRKRRQKTLEWLVAWLTCEAREQPLIAVWDDLQWADPTTLELIELLIESEEQAPLLNVLVFRSEFQQPWIEESMPRIELGRLERQAVEELVCRLTGGLCVPAEVLDQVVAKTDGIPLFVEEVTKLLLESEHLVKRGNRLELVSGLPASAIPATLHDSLMARLDGLSLSREIAQLAATLGRELSYDLIRAVYTHRESLLRQGLAHLVEADLLIQSGEPPSSRYVFRHALIQDVAYESLLKSTRIRYHHQIAQVLEEHFSEEVESRPELLAHHLTEAGLARRAVGWWHRAGERCIERSAHREAVAHLEKAVALLRTLPETPDRLHQELAVQTSLGVPLTAIRGYGAPEVEGSYQRARGLCEQLRVHQLFPVLYGLWRSRLLRAQYSDGLSLGEDLLELAGQIDTTTYLTQAHRSLGAIRFYVGEPGASLEHMNGIIDRQLSDSPRTAALGYDVVDILVTAHSYKSWSLWMLGRCDEAVEASRRAISLAEALDHAFTRALALSFAGWLHHFRRDEPAVRKHAEQAIALARDEGLEMWVGWNNVLLGWAQVERERSCDGIELMREGIAGWRATGADLGFSYWSGLLAEAHIRCGRPEEALRVLREARAFVERSGELFWLPELSRLRGAAKARLGAHDEAQAGFRDAVERARCKGARALEERAASELADDRGVSESRLAFRELPT